jgi:hypothetical protein
VIVPVGVMRPIDGSSVSVNQMLPSAPTRIWRGKLPAGRLYSVKAPAVVTLPIALVVPWSVNQRLPSGPAAILNGALPALRPALYSVTVPSGAAAASDVTATAATHVTSASRGT